MSDEDSDWFEEAVEDDDAVADADEQDGDGTIEELDEALDAAPDESEDGSANAEEDEERASDGDDGDESGAEVPEDASEADGDDADEEWSSPFEDDDGTVDPFAEGEEGTLSEDEDPFSEGEDPFEDAEGSLFEEDFESAFASTGSDFEDDSFESSIPRIDLGIAGLDAMIQGGVPERHLIVTIGSAGTGKTTFGLQFLQHGLERGERGVFITLEQSHDAIVATAEEHGWEFGRHEREDRLAVIDLDPVEMANSLDNIRGELPHLVDRFEADRLVLDSVSLLEMMYEDQARRRTEVFDFTRSLKEAGVTTMLTSEASESNPYASRHGIIEYLTDAVIVLQYVRAETRETRLAVEIQKIRDANHSRETKPYEIETGGISVYQRANIF